MIELNYESLGFKCGIEIHQQLETHKLFCSCPSVIRDDDPDFTVERKMRAVAGELGNVDPAALHEYLRNRNLVYEVYKGTNCLVELDEEPPHPLNREALGIALEVALLLNAKPVDELQVMRKTVVNGSNTSGFQRTVLVALDGTVDSSEGPIGIPTICLEEDAARPMKEEGDTVYYRLDRLGIPLIELGTTPDIKSPKHAREVAEKLGMLLRSTGKVKRGLGTIRQDVNVSIKGGARVEVKGVQALNDIPAIAENEVRRQLNLIEIKEELSNRKIKSSSFKNEYIDVSGVFESNGKDWVKKALKGGSKAYAVKLEGFEGLLGKELMPDYRFGTELAKVAKAVAGLGGIIHSDEKLDEKLIEGVKKKLGGSCFVSVIASEEKAFKALKAIVERCKVALKEVPEETRMASGTLTVYMRPLPGSDRMYPETDEPLIAVTKDMLKEVKSDLSELPEEKAERYKKLGLSDELVNQLVRSRVSGMFDELAKKHSKMKPSLIASTLLMAPKEAKRRNNADISVLTKDHFDGILNLISNGSISKDSVIDLITELCKNPSKTPESIVNEKGLGMMKKKDLEALISKVLKENKELVSQGKKSTGALLGRVMAESQGRANPQEVQEILNKRLK